MVSLDIFDVSHAIRDAVAPVFLLTGIGSIMSVLVNRLARAIDRARALQSVNHEIAQEHRTKFQDELDIVMQRIAWMRWSVGLFIFAGLCVSLSIASIFIGVAIHIHLTQFVLMTFITAMLSLVFGLLTFLREIILASREVITQYKTDKQTR